MELKKLKGINEKRELDLNKMGIFDTSDLIRLFPRAYLDLRVKQPLLNAYHNDIVLTTGKLVGLPQVRYFKRGNGMVKAVCEQEGLYFNVVWFNQSYVA